MVPADEGTHPTRRLGTYLVVLVLAVVLPLAAFSIVVTSWAFHLETGAQRAEFERQTAAAAATVATDMAQVTLLAEALARSPSLAAGDIATFERHIRSVAAATGIVLVLGDRAGMQVINTARPSGQPLPAIPRPELVAMVLTTGRRPAGRGCRSPA